MVTKSEARLPTADCSRSGKREGERTLNIFIITIIICLIRFLSVDALVGAFKKESS